MLDHTAPVKRRTKGPVRKHIHNLRSVIVNNQRNSRLRPAIYSENRVAGRLQDRFVQSHLLRAIARRRVVKYLQRFKKQPAGILHLVNRTNTV